MAKKAQMKKTCDRYYLFFFIIWPEKHFFSIKNIFSLVESDAKVRRCPVHNGDEENAEDCSHCVHQGHEVTLLQSCLNFKDQGDHQETHGKEEQTKGVVLKHILVVTAVVPQST